jgi:hypothetical protein
MKNTLIFCENRNQFFERETKQMTYWTSNKSNAMRLSIDNAGLMITVLNRMIIDADHLIAVDESFEVYL